MVGYCSKDEGRSHFQTARKGVSRTEANVALAEYRKLQRAAVPENRIELGKKNFWSSLLHFRSESVRAISVSPVALVTWLIQDGEYIPGYAWVCPTSADAMEAVRAEAFYVAATCPRFFTRERAYVLFFS